MALTCRPRSPADSALITARPSSDFFPVSNFALSSAARSCSLPLSATPNLLFTIDLRTTARAYLTAEGAILPPCPNHLNTFSSRWRCVQRGLMINNNNNVATGFASCGRAAWRLVAVLVLAMPLAVPGGDALHPPNANSTSASIGHWTSLPSHPDLPVFAYTLDQVTEAATAARIPSSRPSVRRSAEHVFQIGNDELVLVCSNYGSCNLRSDAGAPKVLSSFSPSRNQFGGAFGYLSSAGATATSYFTSPNPTPRLFAIGSVQTSAVFSPSSSAPPVHAIHTTAVLPGGDPAVAVEVQLTNSDASTAHSVRWTEVWGAYMAHLDFFARSPSCDLPHAPASLCDPQNFTSSHYHSAVSFASTTATLRQQRSFLPLTAAELDFVHSTYQPATPNRPLNVSALWDTAPPAVFLTGLCATAPGASDIFVPGSSAGAFFGAGGVGSPAQQLRLDPAPPEADAALLLALNATVPANSTVSIFFLYGYERGAYTVASLRAKYAAMLCPAEPHKMSSPQPLSAVAAEQWSPRLVNVSMPSQPWLGREMAWHSFYIQVGWTGLCAPRRQLQ